MRFCVSCKKTCERKDLIRILKEHKTGDIIVSPNRFQFGRSFYLCKSEDCLSKLSQNKKYKKLFEIGQLTKEKLAI